MRKEISLSVIAVVSVLLIIFLFVYWIPEFSYFIKFNNPIIVSVDDVNFTSDGKYINSFETKIGELFVVNKGVFSKRFSFPKYVACLYYGGPKFDSQYFKNLEIIYSSGVFRQYPGFSNIDIPPNSKESYDVIVRIPLYYKTYSKTPFEISKIRSNEYLKLYLFKIGEKSAPSIFDPGYYSPSFYTSCESILRRQDPEEIIPIVIH